MGIHYDYKSTRGAKAMEKQAKREKKLAEKRAKNPPLFKKLLYGNLTINLSYFLELELDQE